MTPSVDIFEILKIEYGITTEEELDEAIRNQAKIDIAIFCNAERKEMEDDKRRT